MLMEPRDLTEQPGCPFTPHTGSDSCLPCVEKTSQAENPATEKRALDKHTSKIMLLLFFKDEFAVWTFYS